MKIWNKVRVVLAAGLMIFSMLVVTTESRAQENKTAAVDEVFSDLTKAGSPGCALGVYRDGKIAYAKGYGLANLEQNVAITPQSVLDIGSTSKQFTAASILLLPVAGVLRRFRWAAISPCLARQS